MRSCISALTCDAQVLDIWCRPGRFHTCIELALACAAMRQEAALRQSPVPQPMPRGPLPALPADRHHRLRLRQDQLQHALRHRVQRQATQVLSCAHSQPHAHKRPPILLTEPRSGVVEGLCSHPSVMSNLYMAMAMQDCPVPQKCAHAEDLPPHPCHFGPCPSCTRSCGVVQVSSPLPHLSIVTSSGFAQ